MLLYKKGDDGMNKIKSITDAGLFAAIHLIFLLLFKLIPGFGIFLIIILPLASAIYVIKNDFKSSLLFVVSTLIICGVFFLSETPLYILPSLIVGVTYGWMIKHKFQQDEILLATVFAELIGLCISVLFIKLLGLDILQSIKSLFNVSNKTFRNTLPSFALLLSLCQALAVHISIKTELKKLGVHHQDYTKTSKWFYVLLPILVVLQILVSLLYKPIAYSITFIVIVMAILILLNGYKHTKYLYPTIIAQGFLIIIGVFPLMSIIPLVNIPMLLLIPFLPVFITSYRNF